MLYLPPPIGRLADYSPPPHSEEIQVVFPREHVMILAFNRPKALNAMTPTMAEDIKRILDWFDEEPSLWCVLSMRKGVFNLNHTV